VFHGRFACHDEQFDAPPHKIRGITYDDVCPCSVLFLKMPKLITEVRAFLAAARRKDAKHVKIFRSKAKGQTKFKIRCSKYLYTMVMPEGDRAKKLEQSLPPGM
jgi:large subunit ribosomal protein L38e